MKGAKIREKFIELRAQGNSFSSIAEELNVSKQTLINWSKTAKTEIANLKQIELDALQTQYCMARTSRIEFLGELLNRIKEEVFQRNLGDVPSDKLIELALRICKAMDFERQSPKFVEREVRSMTDIDVDNLFTEHVTEWTA